MAAKVSKHFYDDDEYDDEEFCALSRGEWSDGCEAAPWWIDYHVQDSWQTYLDELWQQASSTPDNIALSSQEQQFLFVYGTLKRGFQNHYLLEGSEFVCRAWTKPQAFKLVESQTFPAALMGASGPLYKAVVGELYLVPSHHFKFLDHFENNGNLFNRRKIGVDLDDGASKIAWMYIADDRKFQGVTKLCPSFTRKKNDTPYYSYTKEGQK